MLLDFKWYTIMNDGNTIREDEAKFEDLINNRSNDITEFGLYCPRNNGKVWLDPNTGIFYIGDKENKVELEILDMNDNVFKITDNPEFKDLYRKRLTTRKYVSYDCVPTFSGAETQINGDINDYTFGYAFTIDLFGIETTITFMYGVNSNQPQHMMVHILSKEDTSIKLNLKYPFIVPNPQTVELAKNAEVKFSMVI